jgi:CDP-diacylglycerol--glycerol-3-phosphate 3-phosphatidyltransferase
MCGKQVFYKNIPNFLSVLRMLLVLPFLIVIYDTFIYECSKNWILLLTFFTILFTDIADGYLARKLKCTSNIGAKLDIISDALYIVFSLIIFVYFNIVPIWFIFVTIFKLLEFIVTSRLIRNKQKSEHIIYFDKIGKISICMVMLLPGIFAFRCIIVDYKIVMSTIIYIITIMLLISFFDRIINAIKYSKVKY